MHKLMRVEQRQAEVRQGTGAGADIAGFGVGLVMLEGGEDLFVLEGLAAEFLDEGTGDLGGVADGLGCLGLVVAAHLRHVGGQFLLLRVRGCPAKAEVKGSCDLRIEILGFLFESEGKGDGAIRHEVAVHEGEGLR